MDTTTKTLNGNIRINNRDFYYFIKSNDKVNDYYIGWIKDRGRNIFTIVWQTSVHDKPQLKTHCNMNMDIVYEFRDKLTEEIYRKGGIGMLYKEVKDHNKTVTSAGNKLTPETIAFVKEYGDIATALNTAVKILTENNLLNAKSDSSTDVPVDVTDDNIEIPNKLVDNDSLAAKVSVLIKRVESLEAKINKGNSEEEIPTITEDTTSKSNTEIVNDILSSLSKDKNEEIAVTDDKDNLSKYLDK